MNSSFYFLLLTIPFLVIGCIPDDDNPPPVDEGDLEYIPYASTEYNLFRPEGFPEMFIPGDNPMTEEGVDLGRHLFYDNILSKDFSMSCSSCHDPALSFTDGLARSPGVEGMLGERSSMSLINIGYEVKGLFWDGRIQSLEEQALTPVEDAIELNSDWNVVVDRLRADSMYSVRFRKAFGIKNKSQISKELAAKAIAQFERSLISYSSKYDLRFYQGQNVFLTEQELDGFAIFFDESNSELPDGQCFHCHGGPNLTTSRFFNNGLTEVDSYEDFPDIGLGAVTGDISDYGKFRAVSLRNIALTAPYMHDGSIATLEEVIDFYAEGLHLFDNVDPNLIEGVELNDEEKASLLAFLHTLTDTSYLQNEAYLSPF